MPFRFFRRRRVEEEKVRVELSEESKGRFVVEDVFQIRGVGLILAGRVLEGEMAIGDFLMLPDGRLLRVRGLERRRERVDRVVAREPVGVVVDGVGWKPKRRDLEGYMVVRVVEMLKRRAREKYKHMPKDVIEKLVEKEVKEHLEGELDKIALKIYAPK